MHSTWAEQVWAVLSKDVLSEARSRASLNAMLFFAGMIVLLFSFALGPDTSHLRTAAAGILWLAFIFAGILAFGRAYQLEMENAAFEGLLLLAANRSAIYLGKLLGVVVVMGAVGVLVVPLMAVLYNLDLWGALPGLLTVSLLGIVGFAAIGTLYGALTMSFRAREVLLPLLLLPVTVPVLLAAVKATGLILGTETGNLGLWLELLVAFDIIFVTVGLLTFEFAVGD